MVVEVLVLDWDLRGSSTSYWSLYVLLVSQTVTRPAAPHNLSTTNYIAMDEIDGWIEQLGQCKQLTEADVKKLCEKVYYQPQPRLSAETQC